MRKLILLVLPVLNTACKACFTPSLPSPNTGDTHKDSGEEDSAETGESGESGESSPPIDTTPEPPCDVPEIEPHAYTDPQELPLDQWTCGYFDAKYDYEYFATSTDQADWIRYEVKAAEIRSSADITLLIADNNDPSGATYAQVTGGATTSDPFVVFPTSEATDFRAVIGEANFGYGDDYTWEMMATITKPPVTWTTEEVEPNDEPLEAQYIAEGDIYWVHSDYASDLDNFKIVIPDDSKRSIKVWVVAYNLGSPADMRISLYDPTEKYKYGSGIGVNSYDRDPILEYTTELAGDWIIELREEAGKGSPWYWYTLQVEISDPISDTVEESTEGTGEGT